MSKFSYPLIFIFLSLFSFKLNVKVRKGIEVDFEKSSTVE